MPLSARLVVKSIVKNLSQVECMTNRARVVALAYKTNASRGLARMRAH